MRLPVLCCPTPAGPSFAPTLLALQTSVFDSARTFRSDARSDTLADLPSVKITVSPPPHLGGATVTCHRRFGSADRSSGQYSRVHILFATPSYYPHLKYRARAAAGGHAYTNTLLPSPRGAHCTPPLLQAQPRPPHRERAENGGGLDIGRVCGGDPRSLGRRGEAARRQRTTQASHGASHKPTAPQCPWGTEATLLAHCMRCSDSRSSARRRAGHACAPARAR